MTGDDSYSPDPLVACVGELAGRFGYSAPDVVFGLLPRDDQGRLPSHQAEAAIETAGLNCEAIFRTKLPVQEAAFPVLIFSREHGPTVVHERSGDQVLAWRPDLPERVWLDADNSALEFSGPIFLVTGDPEKMREESAPWHARGRHHWFWSELRKERRSLRSVLLASLIINMLALALPLFSMNVYDRVMPNKATETLFVLATGVLLAFTLEFALKTARTNVLDEVGRKLDLKLSQKIFVRLLSMPMSERRGTTGGLAARVSEYAIVRDFFASTTIVLIVDLAFLFLFLAVITYIGGWLALIPLFAMLCMAVAGVFLQRKVSRAALDAQADHGLQQTLLVETIAGSETIKSLGGEAAMISRWHTLADVGTRSQLKLKHVNSIAVGLAASFQQFSSVSLVVGGYFLFAAGKITMGAIIAIVMLSSRSLSPAGQIAFLLTRGRQARETLGSIEELFERGDERKQGGASSPSVIANATIKLEQLEFAYPETETNAIDGIDLEIMPGDRIALIGRVASGKSTLGRLLCGLYQPTGGAMLVDGIDSRQFRPQDLRRAFRFVGQDANLFTGSIRENLSLSDRGVSEERLHAALHMSGANEFLARDATGFDRPVGEQGRRLSGGQRSFLSLARALVSPTELLFLDEPTGAMDSQTEKLLVERMIAGLPKDRTLLVATHRPALFGICNRIIVLDRGKIVADGPTAEILGRAGPAGIAA